MISISVLEIFFLLKSWSSLLRMRNKKKKIFLLVFPVHWCNKHVFILENLHSKSTFFFLRDKNFLAYFFYPPEEKHSFCFFMIIRSTVLLKVVSFATEKNFGNFFLSFFFNYKSFVMINLYSCRLSSRRNWFLT